MSGAIVNIKGVITSQEVWRADLKKRPDDKRDPYLRVDILQIVGDTSNIVAIKDDDISAKYQVGQSVNITCYVSHFKEWVSYKVFRGDFKAMKLQVAEQKAA